MGEEVIVVEEVASIEGGGKEAFLVAVQQKLAPLLARRAGATLRFLGSTIGSTGAWPEAIAQFELADWAAWARLVEALADPDDRELRAWREESAPLRSRARHATYVALPFSPSLAELARRGVEGKAFSFMRYRAAPGRGGELGAALEKLGQGTGRDLAGAHQSAFSADAIEVVWLHRDLEAITKHAASAAPDVAGEVVAARWEHWAFGVPGGPLWPRAEATQVKIW